MAEDAREVSESICIQDWSKLPDLIPVPPRFCLCGIVETIAPPTLNENLIW